MCYSTEPRYRIYVKGYGFLSFAKNMGKHLSNKHGTNPAGKYWSPGRPLKILFDHPGDVPI